MLAAAVAGYIAGTVISLLLDRMYTGAPVRGPLSLCAGHPLPRFWWSGAIGFVAARGRCAAGCRLPARLWYLPLLGVAAAVLIAVRAVDPRHAALVAVFGTVLLAFIGTDLDRHLLPNRMMYPAVTLAVVLSWAWPDRTALGSLTGGLLGLGLMFAIFMVVPGFGFGDVKLAALLGLVAGVSNTLSALMIGAVAAGLAVLVMLATRRAGMRTAIAYGPYLAIGAFAGMLTL